MADENKAPKHIEKHKKLYKHAKKLVDTTQLNHTLAYNTAAEEHLMGEDGLIDYERLDDTKTQKKFVKSMSDFYVSKAKQHFKIDKDLDQGDQDILMSAYAGTTRAELGELVREKGKDLTGVQFTQEAQRYVNKLRQNLYISSAQHLSHDNIEYIVKYTGIGEMVHKEKLDIQEATGILRAYEEQGGITKGSLREIGINPTKIKKKEAKKKK